MKKSIDWDKPIETQKKKPSKIFAVLFAIVVFIIVYAVLSTGKTSPEKVMKSDNEQISIVSMNETLGYDMRTVHAVVKNNSTKLASVISLKSIYYDAAGNIVGTGNGGALNVPAGQSRTVDILSMSVQNPAKYNVEVSMVLFDQ